MNRVATAVVAIAVAVAAAAGTAPAKRAASPESIVVSCPGASFTLAFDQRRGVVVTSGGRRLAAASLRGWTVSRACRRVANPKWSGKMAEPSNDIYRSVTIHCRIA